MEQNDSSFSPFDLKPIVDADDNPLHDIETNELDATLQNKLKTLYVYDALLALTDSDHLESKEPRSKGITLSEISKYINDNYNVTIDRKSFYPIIHALQASGIDIVQVKGRYAKYRIDSRLFTLAELKMIAGAISSCRILDKNQANDLIAKLAKLTSNRNAREELDIKSFDTANRPNKDDSEKIFDRIHTINRAIQQHKLIKFKYYYYTTSTANNRRVQKLQKARDGSIYRYASPYDLIWEDGKYYLFCNDKKHFDYTPDSNGNEEGRKKIFTHYRVDRMKEISIVDADEDEDVYIPVNEIETGFNINRYMHSVFSMYGDTKETTVTISFPNKGGIIGAIVDKFGTDVKTIPDIGDRSYVKVPVRVSGTFFSWIMQFGGDVQITAPQDVRDRFIAHLNKTLNAHIASTPTTQKKD